MISVLIVCVLGERCMIPPGCKVSFSSVVVIVVVTFDGGRLPSIDLDVVPAFDVVVVVVV